MDDNNPVAPNMMLLKFVPFDKIVELLNREELFCTWTFFEEKYQLLRWFLVGFVLMFGLVQKSTTWYHQIKSPPLS